LKLEIGKLGVVETISDGVIQVGGLDQGKLGEVVVFQGNVEGLIMELSFKNVGIVVFGKADLLRLGDYVAGLDRVLKVPAGSYVQGRVVNALGRFTDGLEWVGNPRFTYVVVEKKAPGIIERVTVKQPLETGVKVVDMLVPLGKGQRELILGDRQTGKTQLCLDTFVHMVFCYNKMMYEVEKRIIIFRDGQVYFKNIMDQRPHLFYVAVGQRRSVVSNILRIMDKASKNDRYNKIIGYNTMHFTTIVDSSASESMAMQYVAPYTACSMAEF